MHVFTIPRESFDETNLDKQQIRQLISKHRALIPRWKKNLEYYEGKHKIISDGGKKNPVVCNHAKDIADTASAYFIGNPVSYASDEDITTLTDALEVAGADEADGDNGLELSIYGQTFEYIYVQEDSTDLQIKSTSVLNTFMVHDDSIEERELFAVYYSIRKDDSGKNCDRYAAMILTENYCYNLLIDDNDEMQTVTEEAIPHYMGEIPIIEYQNNKLGIGDFELQIPLIDAYNSLMSDRLTDKEEFIDAILALYGTMLTDDCVDESDDLTYKAKEKLKEERILELPDGTKAEYLTRTFDEAGVEVLKRALEQDIHKFSHIPCMSDESFGGNVSGVAMEFKLLGMENITKIKTRYYKKGLRKRLRIVNNFLDKQGKGVDLTGITPTFTRALPKNLLEISQVTNNLWGKVSRKTLLSQIPFVNDVDAEITAIDSEMEKEAELQREIFTATDNTEPIEETEFELKE